MRVLVAEDDKATRVLITRLLEKMGHTVLAAKDGDEAMSILQSDEAPQMAILDWLMPGLTGVEVCREVREKQNLIQTYMILLTIKKDKKDIVSGLQAGANDYITKPFHVSELEARIMIGVRSIELLNEVKTLRGLLPICGWCKSIKDQKDDQEYWQSIEEYLSLHSDVVFSHCICSECKDKVRSQKAG